MITEARMCDPKEGNMNNHMKAEKWSFKRHYLCKFTIPEELKIVERYKNGETFSNMAEELGASRHSLWEFATKVYGVESYQTSGYPTLYDINTEAFEDIDSEKSAYALGLIVTDGYIHMDNNEIHFTSTDKEQIDNLKQCLDCTQAPYVSEPRTGEINGRPVKGRKKIYQLCFGPEKVCQDFIQYFAPKSSDRDNIPREVKKSEYVKHFVRGVIDGDGCISGGVYITGNRGILEDTQEILISRLDINKTKLHKKNGKSSSYDLQIKKQKDLERIYNWLYESANYYLSRKKDKFSKLIN